MGRRQRFKFEKTKGAPVAPEKADDDGTTFKKVRKVDETAGPTSEPEQGRHLAGLYGLSGETRVGERLDRAPHGGHHVWFGVRLVFATTCFKLRLQRHGAAPSKRYGTRGAFLIPADLRHPLSQQYALFLEGMSMDRLAAMETFVRVVDAGSFSGAAKQLRLGQPAVSKTIAQLEERLGVRLLLRSTHGLKPTEAGRNFYQRARRAIEEADEAELVARGAAASLSGRLRICAPVTFARLHVMPRLALFLAEHPALEVDVLLSDANKDLIGEGIDVALRLGQLADSSFTARRIG